MASTNFYLKNTKAKNSAIQLHFHFNSDKIKLSTQKSVPVSDWSNKAQRVKSSFANYKDYNSRLKQLASIAEDVYLKLELKGEEISKDAIKEQYELQAFGKVAKEKVTLFSFIDSYIEYKLDLVKLDTIKVYRSTRNHLQGFVKKYNYKLDFNKVDLVFLDKFTKYLIDAGVANQNSRSKYISTIKIFMNEAYERNHHSNTTFKKFSAPRVTSHNIYLNDEEVAKIAELDLSQRKGLERVRDLFIVGCYTGLRFSDYSQIRAEHINLKKGIIQLQTQKTSGLVSIPIHDTVRQIFNKYKGTYDNMLPPSITNQKTNEALKLIGELAGLTQMEGMPKIVGGVRVIESIEKYKLIKTHTARRSFASNAFLAGISAIKIMKITGHKTEREFLKYIKISSEQNAVELKDHAFFKGQSKLKVVG